MTEGVSATSIPHALRVLIFSSAVPFPPEIMAPACPMRFPGGAVLPPIKPTTGFVMLAFTHSAASSSACTADFANHDDCVCVRIFVKRF